jgi:GH18 family chitinase
MLAFAKATVPTINACLDFWNVMTYDMMNRRDSVTKHHTGIGLSLDAVDAYVENGVPPAKVNLGFAFYLKWFKTDPRGGCDKNPIGCKTVLMEDPVTGADLGQGGGFSWHDGVPPGDVISFNKALVGGKYDDEEGGHYFWDSDENRWWTWDTPQAIAKKFPAIVERKGLGGVFAWGLGEDAPDWDHLKALTAGYQRHIQVADGEDKGSVSSPAAKQSGSASSSPGFSILEYKDEL